MKKIFVTAIGTDSGKTLVSALLCLLLDADYWKPIQSGLPRDTDTVKRLCGEQQRHFFEEACLFTEPLSPHAAAVRDKKAIILEKIQLPENHRALVVEGAGGILAPLNEKECLADLITKLALPVVLVSNHYLGSINHTLLTFNELQRRKIEILGIVFNGNENPDTEKIILQKTNLPLLFRVPLFNEINADILAAFAQKIKKESQFFQL